MNIDRLLIGLTPEKSRVVVNKDTIKIKYINKVGAVKKRMQCNSCEYLGKVQIGLGFGGMDYCCDAKKEGWREFKGRSASKCSLYKEKAEECNNGE